MASEYYSPHDYVDRSPCPDCARLKQSIENGATRLFVQKAEQKAEQFATHLEQFLAYEKTNRLLIKAALRRIDALERGDPPAPQDRPDALRWDEV